MSLYYHAAGSRVRLRYAGGRSWLFPYHDCIAVVVTPPYGPGKRNHLVHVDGGRLVNVPAGHLKEMRDGR